MVTATLVAVLLPALSADKEIELIGIAKYTADDKTKEALDNRFNVYVPKAMVKQFNDKCYNITGTIPEAIQQSDPDNRCRQRRGRV